MLERLVALCFFLSALSSALGQEAVSDGLPPSAESVTPPKDGNQNAWIDLRQQPAGKADPQTAPDWVEAVNMTAGTGNDGTAKTIFRIRVAKPVGDLQVMYLRLFFDDKDTARPEIVAWDESGTQVLRSGALGSGTGLATSDSVMIPMKGISSVDVEVAGDGKTVRGAYLDWMTSSEVVHPVNSEHRDIIPEPFSSLPPLHSPDQDTEQFGTVTATLSSDTISIGSDFEHAATFQFGIESQPLMALLTFEVASPRVDSPPQVYINGQGVGVATFTLPALADPAYRGVMEPLVKEMHFQYTGWLRAQVLVPVGSLNVGNNNVTIVAGAGTNASAIRGTQVQLKYLWEKSDYLLKTSR